MNLVELESIQSTLEELCLHEQRMSLPLSINSSLMIMRHSPVVEKDSPELERPLYLVSFWYMDKTLNKNKSCNIDLFISHVGREVYDYLEGLVSKDSHRYANKGSGISYMRLSIEDVRYLLLKLYEYDKQIFLGGER